MTARDPRDMVQLKLGIGEQLGLLDLTPVDEPWRVRESPRARRLTVKVFPGGRVEIVVPPGTRPTLVQQFVRRHREWIDRKVDEFRHLDAGATETFPLEINLQSVGERWQVAYERAPRAPRVREGVGVLIVRGDLERTRLVSHALQRWLMTRARAHLVPWLDRVSSDLGLPFARAQIRRQRTRWGSCSRTGTISLNACLVFQPADVVRYLFVHELAHTRQMNHSRRFWRLVEQHEPEWKSLDAQLMRGWQQVPHWVFR